VIVSGNVDPEDAFKTLERQLGAVKPGQLRPSTAAASAPLKTVRERIDQPLAQGGIGYVVEGPAPGTREAFAWRMLLYVLTHDYSGRLGNSAIRDQGLLYYIGSAVRTDGRRTWAVISSGVDPDKADSVEREFRSQIARLATDPPTTAEVEAARNHLLGRDLTAAQSNEELAAKLARQFVETGGLRSHQQLRSILATITPADLAAIAPSFARGTIVRVDVAATGRDSSAQSESNP
jgi:predicted Zn-dependent peptidase